MDSSDEQGNLMKSSPATENTDGTSPLILQCTEQRH